MVKRKRRKAKRRNENALLTQIQKTLADGGTVRVINGIVGVASFVVILVMCGFLIRKHQE